MVPAMLVLVVQVRMHSRMSWRARWGQAASDVAGFWEGAGHRLLSMRAHRRSSSEAL